MPNFITPRDLVVAVIVASGTLAVVAAQAPASLLKSSVFDWGTVAAREVAYGSVRQFLRAPTVTLAELELHVTTLNPGQTSHAPHQHANEELIIIRSGTVETLSLGEWKRLGPGSVIFNASNDLHGIRNVGNDAATYHVVNWKQK
jgi:quercetin dioxygenase-like cupin family protein